MDIKINKITSMSEIAKYSYELTINDKMFEIKKIRKNKWVGNSNYRIDEVVKDNDGFILDENWIAFANNIEHAKKIALEFYNHEYNKGERK
jgi:hypothetical protein